MEKYMETNMGGSQISENITAQFEKMQKEIDELRGKKTESRKITKVAVFGGFKHFGDFDTAKNWIYEKLWKEWLPTANDIYCKGDFTGILFCKFETEDDRNKVVSWFRKASMKVDDETIWSKPDALLRTRSVNSIVFAAKTYLKKWGFENRGLWADTEKGILEYMKNLSYQSVWKMIN